MFDQFQPISLLGPAPGQTASWTGYRPYCANFLDSCSAMAWPATAFQLILDLVKRWWLDGFAACMVNGQLAIACPLKSHIPYITAYIRKSCFARAWPTIHPEDWHRIQHQERQREWLVSDFTRMEAQRSGRTHYHLFVAQEHRMEIEQ